MRDSKAECRRCGRLVELREDLRQRYPEYHNAPVEGHGPLDARLLVIGLAPGLHGANRTGIPFHGDHSGDALYACLRKLGSATIGAGGVPQLVDCRISNALRCLPPGNRPTGGEVRQCRAFLASEIAGLAQLRSIVTLGRVAHDAVAQALSLRPARFAHGAVREHGLLRLFASYHCSRYNFNTGRLDAAMLQQVLTAARAHADA